MQDNYKTRLFTERKELADKTLKLGEFLNSDKVKAIDPKQGALMILQFKAMTSYLECLELRINLL